MNQTIRDLWAATLENFRDELAGIDSVNIDARNGRRQQLRECIDALENGPTKSMLRDALEERVGACDVLDISTDDADRYTIVIEREARREYIREELDGSITGPLSEGDWVNLLASEKSRQQLRDNGWSDDVRDDDRVVIWGRGQSSTRAIRETSSDLAYMTKKAREWLTSLNTTDSSADDFVNDHWCVALDPRDISAADLARDGAVAGHEVVEV